MQHYQSSHFPKRFQDGGSPGGTLTLDLESYTKFSVELNFFDGIKNIRRSDRKRLVNFSVRTSCKGLKENPCTPGRVIELGGLYVGREQEFSGMGLLTSIKGNGGKWPRTGVPFLDHPTSLWQCK
jgi:hypothetical protein